MLACESAVMPGLALEVAPGGMVALVGSRGPLHVTASLKASGRVKVGGPGILKSMRGRPAWDP